MPNTKSAIRRVRRVKKQTQINRIRKSKYKSAVKEMETLLKSKEKAKAKKLQLEKFLAFQKKFNLHNQFQVDKNIYSRSTFRFIYPNIETLIYEL